MHEARQTFCVDLFSMFHKLGVVLLCIFVSLCVLCKLLPTKTKGSVYIMHANFRGETSGKKARKQLYG